MKILIDENMPLAETLFSAHGSVVKRPGRGIVRADLLDVDALMVRSVTRVDASLLQGTPVKFVGTATIGTDHLDLSWLAANHIQAVNAPGCNARAVVEYVLAALMSLEKSRGLDWRRATIGIVGVGNVGSRLQAALTALGCRVLACDPPLAEQGVTGLCSFDDIRGADIITFHTPLTSAGAYPTFHLADEAWLRSLSSGCVLINAARGAVIDNAALCRVLDDRTDLAVVLDVWENEPLPMPALLHRVDLATPHIAGYSFDGKVKGTWQVYEAFCRWQGTTVPGDWQSRVEPAFLQQVDLRELAVPGRARDVLAKAYDILQDDRDLRATLALPEAARAGAFDRLRKDYRLRREFDTVALLHDEVLAAWPQSERLLLAGMGFRTGGMC